MSSSIGWRLVPFVLLWSLYIDFVERDRAWAGDWVRAMTWAGLPLLLTTLVVASVAAHDAGSAFTGSCATGWDSMSRRGRDVLRVWAGATAPFVLVHLFTIAAVSVALVLDGAAYGQTLAPLVQQVCVLGFAGALGVVVGSVCGPRLGAFIALVLGAYLIYWRGYLGGSTSPPTRIVSASSSLIGVKLSEPLVAVQAAGATVWVLVLLSLVIVSVPDRQGQRRPSSWVGASAIVVLVLIGVATPRIIENWKDPVPTAAPHRCSSVQSPGLPPMFLCLYVGHDADLGAALSLVRDVRDTASRNGMEDLIPLRVVEVSATRGGAAGQLTFQGYDRPDDVSRTTILTALLPGLGCPQLRADLLTSAAAAFVGATSQAEQTLSDMAEGRPASQWPMTPKQLRDHVSRGRTCDLGPDAALS